MKRILTALSILAIALAAFLFLAVRQAYRIQCVRDDLTNSVLNKALGFLKNRNDSRALSLFQETLADDPKNICALWGRAEIYRRARQYRESESILNDILNKDPKYGPALNSLAYIKDKQGNTGVSLRLIRDVLKNECSSDDDKALANVLLASINARRFAQGGLFDKIRYGTQIKGYLLKAKKLSPDLPEVRLGLGSFYLLAPSIAGGDLGKATRELEAAVRIAPDFATANARLAQCYKKRGIEDKYKFFIDRAKKLDPQNEALKETAD